MQAVFALSGHDSRVITFILFDPITSYSLNEQFEHYCAIFEKLEIPLQTKRGLHLHNRAANRTSNAISEGKSLNQNMFSTFLRVTLGRKATCMDVCSLQFQSFSPDVNLALKLSNVLANIELNLMVFYGPLTDS